MKKGIAVYILLLAFANSCKKPDTYCSVEKPLEEIQWLKEEVKNSPTNLWIYKQTYKSQEGFYIYKCLNSNCTVTTSYYKSCDNTLLYQSGGIVGNSFPSDFDLGSTYKELIYP